MGACNVCNPGTGEKRKDNPWGFLDTGVAELVSSRFRERPCFKKVRQTVIEEDIQHQCLLPCVHSHSEHIDTNAYTHTTSLCVHMCTHVKFKKRSNIRPSSPTVNVYPNNMKSVSERDSRSLIFSGALYTKSF